MHDAQRPENQEHSANEYEDSTELAAPARSKTRRYVMGGAIIVMLVIAVLVFVPVLRPAFSLLQRSTSTPNAAAQMTPLPTPVISSIVDGDATQITPMGDVIYVSTANRYIYELNASDGRVLWQVRLDGANYTPPQVVGGIVYLIAENGESQPGFFYALSASDGHVLWKYQDVGLFYSTNPVVDGTAYLISVKELIALDASNGKVRWKYSPREGAASSSVACAGIVYFGANWGNTGPSTLYALRASDGAILWRYASKDSVVPQMVQDSTVYAFAFTGNGHQGHSRMIALATSNGQQLWQQPFEEGLVNAMQVDHGVAYLLLSRSLLDDPTPSRQGRVTPSTPVAMMDIRVASKKTVPLLVNRSAVYALNINDGKILWRYQTNNGSSKWPGFFQIDNGTLYTSTFYMKNASDGIGSMYALNVQDGRLLWHRQNNFAPANGTVSKGVLYISTQDSMSAALRASDGKELWRYPLSSVATYSPTLSGNTLYIGENNGLVIALDASSGKARWHYQTNTSA